MKFTAYKKLANTLSKAVHAFSLCFDSIDFDAIEASYSSGVYVLSLRVSIDGFGCGSLDSSSSGNDAKKVISEFIEKLVNKVDDYLLELKAEEKNDMSEWSNSRYYNHEYSCLSQIASFEMLKDILIGFRP